MWVRMSIRARCTPLCDKVCQWLATSRGFSLSPLVSFTNKTDPHDITEILFKMALNTIKQTKKQTIKYKNHWNIAETNNLPTAGLESNYRLIHEHFHIGLVFIPRPPYWPETQSRVNMGRGMITRPIWKCPCIKLFITYFRHLEKRHPYWPETKSRPILVRANMGLDMEVIL